MLGNEALIQSSQLCAFLTACSIKFYIFSQSKAMVEIQEHESGDENSAQPEPQQEPQPEPQQQQRTSRPNAGRGIYDVLVVSVFINSICRHCAF